VIKEHATKAALDMREGKAKNLLAAIGADSRIPLDAAALGKRGCFGPARSSGPL
jgi:hypothetical protein